MAGSTLWRNWNYKSDGKHSYTLWGVNWINHIGRRAWIVITAKKWHTFDFWLHNWHDLLLQGTIIFWFKTKSSRTVRYAVYFICWTFFARSNAFWLRLTRKNILKLNMLWSKLVALDYQYEIKEDVQYVIELWSATAKTFAIDLNAYHQYRLRCGIPNIIVCVNRHHIGSLPFEETIWSKWRNSINLRGKFLANYTLAQLRSRVSEW